MARQQPERALHNAVAAFLRVALPEDAVWTTVGHGGGGKVRGAQLKAAGVMPGWPDIQILYRGALICFELKSKNGRMSQEQHEAATRIFRAGGVAILARSVDVVERALRGHGVPLRATTGAIHDAA